MNKLARTVRDIRYERMCIGERYAKNESGVYLELYEVEEKITRKIGWYAGSISGGGPCPVQLYDSTKVFESEADAREAGMRLPTKKPWRLIDEDWEQRIEDIDVTGYRGETNEHNRTI